MKRKIPRSQLKTEARYLSNKIVESIDTTYGVVDFAKGPPLKRTLGSHVITLMDGGLNMRCYFDGRIVILCRLVVSYPTSIQAIGESVTHNIEYWVNRYGFTLKSLEILIDGMK